MSDCKVISVVNWKGGVGKTTFTHHLGTGLQELSNLEQEKYLGFTEKIRVLLIDTDAQCNLSVSCLTDDYFDNRVYKEGIGTIKDLYQEYLERDEVTIDVDDYILENCVRSDENRVYDRVDLLPAHQDLIFTDMNFAVYKKANFKENLIDSDIYKFQVLHRILEKVRDNYNYIFIDCPPNLNFITQNALYASDYYIIPTLLDKLSSYGIASITNKVDELNRTFALSDTNYEAVELVGIVADKVIERNQEPKESQFNVLSYLKERFPDKVFKLYLTDGDGISKASAKGYPVYGYVGSNKNAVKQSRLMKQILIEFLNQI